MSDGQAPHRSNVERLTDLITAIDGIAHELGARLLRLDALQSKVVQHAPEVARPYWANRQAASIHGLLLYEKTIATELAKRGVHIWTDADQCWRIVNENWLTSHADIRAHVAAPRIPGRVCRFCRIVELPSSQPLVVIEGKRAAPLETASTQLQPGSVFAHEQCVPHWERWLEIANRYPTQEAAEAADREAGRITGGAPSAPPEPEYLPRAPEGFVHETKGADQ